LEAAPNAPLLAREQMPDDFSEAVHDSVSRALDDRLKRLAPALDEL
jgi:hypothetical protein